MYKEWLLQNHVWEVYFRALYAVLDSPEKRKAAIGRRLRDELGDAGMRKLEDDLFAFMSSIPRSYTVAFPIRLGASLGKPEVKLNRSLTLCDSKGSAPPIGLGNLMGGLLMAGTRIGLSSPSLKVRAHGYIGSSPENSGSQIAISLLKQFVALSLASQAMVFTHSADLSLFREFRVIDDKAGTTSDIPLPEPVRGILRRVVVPANMFGEPVGEPVSGGALSKDSVPGPLHKRAEILARRLSAISRVLTPNTKDVQHIRTAAEWLFDSEAESNETTALLYASIGLEAVLDSPLNEVTARLGDRLAWLLGRTLRERNKLTSQYITFYKVRCGLVHGRERRLDDDGRQQLRWGRQTLSAVLAHELRHWPDKSAK